MDVEHGFAVGTGAAPAKPRNNLVDRQFVAKDSVQGHILRPEKFLQREDDQPESIRVRMAAYETSTAPLADFYRKRGLLVPISAEGKPEEIYQRTLTALNALG